MKRFFPFYVIAFLLISLFVMMGSQSKRAYAQEDVSPTPTYDLYVEPFVPDNPTDYELGRNLYWHHCMPCHGEKGQGLTDEFRATWVPDHQNCWARGCHAGRIEDQGFPIPTVVPAVVSSAKLSQFSSLQALYEYLKATHPPQYPGHLQDEQYRTIAVYLFAMNDRPLEEPTLIPTSTPPPTSTSLPEPVPAENAASQPNLAIYVAAAMIIGIVVVWGIRKRQRP